MGFIRTPSSTWALVGSSESLWLRTFWPVRVLTKVVRPLRDGDVSAVGVHVCWELHTSARCTTDHQTELDTLLHVLLPADLDLSKHRSALLSQADRARAAAHDGACSRQYGTGISYGVHDGRRQAEPGVLGAMDVNEPRTARSERLSASIEGAAQVVCRWAEGQEDAEVAAMEKAVESRRPLLPPNFQRVPPLFLEAAGMRGPALRCSGERPTRGGAACQARAQALARARAAPCARPLPLPLLCTANTTPLRAR